jgi:hypothetical protein
MDYKKARYFIGCFFSESSLFETTCVNNFDKSIASIISMSDLKFKLEGIRYIKGLNIKKIRKSNIVLKPILNMVEKSEPCEMLSIYISDDDYNKANSPQLMINLHASLKGLISCDNITLKTFLIVAIRKDQEIDFLKIRSIFTQAFIDNKGIVGGIFKNSSYILSGDTYIEWAYRNFPIQIQKMGLSNWNPGFDEIF